MTRDQTQLLEFEHDFDVNVGRADDVNPRYGSKRWTAVVVYVDTSRPLDKGDILGDFAWRRTHSSPLPNEVVKRIITPTLQRLGFDLTSIEVKYDRYAGCSMCPCSPGYTVKLIREKNNSTLKYQKQHIWLKPKNTEVQA